MRLALCLLLSACTTSLPHRPVTELTDFGQGHNPGRGGCVVGQVPFFLELDDGETIFLECYRGVMQ